MCTKKFIHFCGVEVGRVVQLINPGTLRVQKTESDLLQMELQGTASNLMWSPSKDS